MIKVAIAGAAGRMGKALIRSLGQAEDMQLSGALVAPADPILGKDAGELVQMGPCGVPLTDDHALALNGAQVAIDFTLPAALEANLRACVAAGCPIVIGTTGLSDSHRLSLEKTSHQIPIVYGRNMSVGVNVFTESVGRAARALGDDYDVEIIEAHHRQKVDAPSGTALAIGERIAKEWGRGLDELAVRARDGITGPRVPGTIGFSSVRGGDIVGEHEVRFISGDERLSFFHEAIDRRTFASGALRAARWLAGRAPGLYSMNEVLGMADSG